jgi:hypothetical protein
MIFRTNLPFSALKKLYRLDHLGNGSIQLLLGGVGDAATGRAG